MNLYIRDSVKKLHAYVPGEQPRDKTMVKLNTNENPYPPSPEVFKALSRISPEDMRRYPDPKCNELRSQIAAMHGYKPENVFIGNGSDEILSLCTAAFVENTGSIAFFEPSYSLYEVLADIRDVPCIRVELDESFQWRCPEIKASLFFLANPNAPTGIVYPKNEIAGFCRNFEGVIVIDEAYSDFADDNCMDFPAKFKNTIVARTMSKSYSLAGARVGYAVGPAPLIEALFKVKDSYNVNALTQKIALAALADRKYHSEITAKIRASRERMAEQLRKKGFVVVPSGANFLWAKPANGNAEEIFLQLHERNVYVRYFKGKLTEEYLRITVGTDEQIDRFFEALAKIAKEKRT